MTTLKDLRAAWMEDPEFRAEYDALAAEFSIAEALIAARKRAHLSQDEVARRMDATKDYVVRMEGVQSNPSIEALRRFAAATGTRLKIVFEPTDETAP
ncbi:MAG: helix-turn-helix domain-containing protein [Alphaproteobacteria bacterium]|jgi:transcriptional regulator with XRE-family HTH domain|nr:helix-turn-helix domain-containing protein [Alphaproteobacteria bacterium]